VGLSDDWWLWLLAAAALAAAVALSGRYRALVWKARRAAVRRGLIELPPGRALRPPAQGFWSDLSWLAFPIAVWVGLGPWIWGYDDVAGGVTADVVTAAALAALAAGAILFPALWALGLVAGLWLVIAPWLVGYGDEGGAVGLSDSIAGVVVCAVSIAALAGAERRLVSGGGPGTIGRIRPPDS
jgi:hypothetical protein